MFTKSWSSFWYFEACFLGNKANTKLSISSSSIYAVTFIISDFGRKSCDITLTRSCRFKRRNSTNIPSQYWRPVHHNVYTLSLSLTRTPLCGSVLIPSSPTMLKCCSKTGLCALNLKTKAFFSIMVYHTLKLQHTHGIPKTLFWPKIAQIFMKLPNLVWEGLIFTHLARIFILVLKIIVSVWFDKKSNKKSNKNSITYIFRYTYILRYKYL